jgi:serine/threonine-protein phosphatase CPPED1
MINYYFYGINLISCSMKLTRKLLLIFLIVFGFSLHIFAKTPRAQFTFVQITDIQMGMISKNVNFDEEERLYRLAIAEINLLKPKFVVVTGDLVNNRTDTNQIKAFKRLTSLISKKIPVYILPGNHDVGQIPDKEKLDFYFKHHTADKFNFRYKDLQFIGINSSLINSGIAAESDQLEWLKKVLSENSNATRKIVFTHHPFFIADINEKDSYSNIPLQKRLDYMQLFKDHGVIMIFAGHYHNNAFAQYDGIEMITTSAVGKPLGKAKSGYRVVSVYKDSISNRYVELTE